MIHKAGCYFVKALDRDGLPRAWGHGPGLVGTIAEAKARSIAYMREHPDNPLFFLDVQKWTPCIEAFYPHGSERKMETAERIPIPIEVRQEAGLDVPRVVEAQAGMKMSGGPKK